MSIFVYIILAYVAVTLLFGKFQNEQSKFLQSFAWLGLLLRDDGQMFGEVSLVQALKNSLIWIVISCARVLILNSLLFLGEIYCKLAQLKEQYQYEVNNRGNRRGYGSFGHFLWANTVFLVFSWFENPVNWMVVKVIGAGPVLEELMFRGLILGIYRDQGFL